MSDPCFHLGCIDHPKYDECQECGRWTGAKSRIEEAEQERLRKEARAKILGSDGKPYDPQA